MISAAAPLRGHHGKRRGVADERKKRNRN